MNGKWLRTLRLKGSLLENQSKIGGNKMIEFIHTDEAPQPGGHYSQGVKHNNVVYVSGQLPIDPVTGEKKHGAIEQEAQQVLQNMEAVLKSAGSSRDKVLKVTIYISDVSLWGEVNTIYAKFFGDHKPARTVVPSGELHYGFKIELDAIAAV